MKKKEENARNDELTSLLEQANAERRLLSSIISQFPSHVYWLNCENIYLGCNILQARSFGLKSCDEIIGKTNSDLLPLEDAAILDKINRTVLETGQPYEGEELAAMQHKSGYYLSQKMPLLDDGKIIGLLGMSINITDRKKAEKLEIKNKLQKIKIDEQEEFKKFTARIVHDITSPLISLEYFVKYCDELSCDHRDTLVSIATSIRNIAGDLLNRYMHDYNKACSEQEQYILASLVLLELIAHKRYQYKESKIEWNYSSDPTAKFIFIKCDLSSFGRMISNLINNSVDYFENRGGIVTLSIKLDDKNFKIILKDNGKGMSSEFVYKINNNILVGTTKKGGHGIGLGQIMDTLERYNGKLFAESKEGEGTTITIAFPIEERPSWIAERIVLPKGGTVVIVDSEPSIYNIWKTLLKKNLKDLNLVFFANCQEAFAYIESFDNKEKIFLLADLKFENNNPYELNVILQNHVKERLLIVTDIHSNKMIHELAERSGIKILLKQFISDIAVVVE